MNLSKEQWSQVETELSHVFGNVKLRCDGYEVTATIRQAKPLKLVIEVYVNGYIKGEWCIGEHEESRKFWCEKKVWGYPLAKRTEAKKKLTKRGLDQWHKDFYKRITESCRTYYSAGWTSPAAFCRHIRKTCTSIEIVKVGY